MKKIIISTLALLSTSTFAASLEAFDMKAEAMNSTGIIGNISYITTNHYAGVRNLTDQPKEFVVTYTICAKSCDSSHHYKIKLLPYDQWQDGFTLHLTPRYGNKGNYQIIAKTQVSGSDGFYQETISYGTIQIN